MKKYELLLILPGTLDENEAEARSQEVLNLVSESSENFEIDFMGKNRLAYPIKQIRYGYFYTIVFEAEVENLQKIQQALGLQRDLLRAIITIFNAKAGVNKISYDKGVVKEESTFKQKDEKLSEVKSQTVEKDDKVEEKPKEEFKKQEEKTTENDKKDVNLDDINKKLDELLDDDSVADKI